MPNLAVVIRDEIRRLARKEIKANTAKTRKAVVSYRGEITKLRRQVQEQQKRLALLERQSREGGEPQAEDKNRLEGVRYSARSVRAQRAKLGLSAADYGQLVGVSPLTIYSWERGKSRPRKAQLSALVAVRNIGKREARQKLKQRQPSKTPRKPR